MPLFQRHQRPPTVHSVEVAAVSSVGGRETNQDSCRAEPVAPGRNLWGFSALAIIADGMGGHQDGLTASSLAVATVWEVLAATPEDAEEFSPAWRGAPPGELLARTIRLANSRVYNPAPGDERPMGTTLVLAAVHGDEAFIAHVGDSRAYLVSEGNLRQVTQDHTYVAGAVAAGEMTPEEALASPFAGQLTRGVGLHAEVEADVTSVPVGPGTVVVLCSDGLTGVVADEGIREIVLQSQGAAQVAQDLVALAEMRETTDNVSVACLYWRGPDKLNP